jgi:hypothetical protein
LERWKVWRKADAATRYYKALLRFTDERLLAKRHRHKEASTYWTTRHSLDDEDRWAILDSYREALGRQLLTPPDDVASVNWKPRHLNVLFNGANKDDVVKAIAEDIAFLDAQPTRDRPPLSGPAGILV